MPAPTQPTHPAPAGPAPGSTLHLDLPPTIGIAPGAAWCGLAVRIGRAAPDASTVGRAAAVGDRIGPAADRAWLQAVDERIGMLMRRHNAAARADLAGRGITVPPDASPFYVALAQVPLPEAWGDLAPGAKATRPLPRKLARHLAEARALYSALLLAYPGALVTGPVTLTQVIARPQGSGVAGDYLPATFIGPRKPAARFGPHDGAIVGGRARGDRGHEQAAYHAAGLAHLTGHGSRA